MKRYLTSELTRETIVYKDSNSNTIETSGYIVENPKEPDFLYINRHLNLDTGKLAETIAINKSSLISRRKDKE